MRWFSFFGRALRLGMILAMMATSVNVVYAGCGKGKKAARKACKQAARAESCYSSQQAAPSCYAGPASYTQQSYSYHSFQSGPAPAPPQAPSFVPPVSLPTPQAPGKAGL